MPRTLDGHVECRARAKASSRRWRRADAAGFETLRRCMPARGKQARTLRHAITSFKIVSMAADFSSMAQGARADHAPACRLHAASLIFLPSKAHACLLAASAHDDASARAFPAIISPYFDAAASCRKPCATAHACRQQRVSGCRAAEPSSDGEYAVMIRRGHHLADADDEPQFEEPLHARDNAGRRSLLDARDGRSSHAGVRDSQDERMSIIVVG